MKHLMYWILGLVILATASNLSGARPTFQQSGKVTTIGKQAKKNSGRQPQASPAKKRRIEKQNALKKLLPTLKMTLGESIGLAEKQLSGKAFEASIEMVAGKPSFQIDLFVGDKVATATVDPETKAVKLVGDKDAGAKPGHDDDDEDADEDEHGDDHDHGDHGGGDHDDD